MKPSDAQLKAVIVDLDGTLYDLAPVRRQMARRLTCFALAHPKRGWKTVRVLRAFRRAQERLRRPGASPLTQVAAAALMTGCSTEFVQASVTRWMEQEPLSAVSQARYAGVAEFLEWARQRDLSIAVVSDYDPRRKLRALGLDRYVRVCVWAQQSEVCAFKPDPRGLMVAARRLGIHPAEATYIGDRLEVDGAAAQAAGMPVILLRPEGKSCIAPMARSWYEIRDLLEKRIGATDYAHPRSLAVGESARIGR